MSILGILATVYLALYPEHFKYALSGALTFKLGMTAYQAHGQCQFFIRPDSAADLAGKYISEDFSQGERDSMAIVAASRFDARVASLKMDSDKVINFTCTTEGLSASCLNLAPVLVIGSTELFREEVEFDFRSGEFSVFTKVDEDE